MRKISEIKGVIRDLSPRVEAAFSSRVRETFPPGADTSLEELRRQEIQMRALNLQGRSDDEVIDVNYSYPTGPHHVYVESPDDYEVLLRLSIRRIARGSPRPADLVRRLAHDTRLHEEAHAKPYIERNENLGEDQTDQRIGIKYGVAFIENRRTGQLRVRPYLRTHAEKTHVGTERQSLAAPDDLSTADKTAIRYSK